MDSLKQGRKQNLKKVAKLLIQAFEKYILNSDKNEIFCLKQNPLKQDVRIINEKETEKISYKDSSNEDSIISSELEKLDIQEKICNEYLKYKCSKLILTNNLNNDWKIFLADTPIQTNSSDCGVFLCKFIDYFVKNIEFDFCNDDMYYFRKLIAIELLNGDLITK